MTAMLLRSPMPMVMPWGEDGVMLYNDASSVLTANLPRLTKPFRKDELVTALAQMTNG
ncbi:hypothetical protein MMMDOFMJ_2997 [Methylobacterium gnaphalii]|nr:hypothetical protein MMMDOFMJ_2997 [Methylobacterium gnaphalii]